MDTSFQNGGNQELQVLNEPNSAVSIMSKGRSSLKKPRVSKTYSPMKEDPGIAESATKLVQEEMKKQMIEMETRQNKIQQ